MPVNRAPAAEKWDSETPSCICLRTTVSGDSESAAIRGSGGPLGVVNGRSPNSMAVAATAIPNATERTRPKSNGQGGLQGGGAPGGVLPKDEYADIAATRRRGGRCACRLNRCRSGAIVGGT